MTLKLGKLPPKHDVRTLRFGKYSSALPPVPPACDYSLKVSAWPMLGNDEYGDCTFAGAVHLSQCWADNAGRPFEPDDRAVVAEYLSFTGGVDSGCVELDVLKHWRVDGIVGHKIGAFAALDHGERDHLMQATYLFSGAPRRRRRALQGRRRVHQRRGGGNDLRRLPLRHRPDDLPERLRRRRRWSPKLPRLEQ